MNKIELIKGDCLKKMDELIERGVKVDAVITDIPFGTTKNKWDVILPFELMWEKINKISKNATPIVLFSIQPFTSKLICSNIKNYKHNWIWNKNNSAGFATAKYRPFITTEEICVFSSNGKKVNYYPIMETRGKPRNKGGYSVSKNYGITPSKGKDKNNIYYPKHIINIGNANQKGKTHSTQKPVALMEYLIKTYTNEGNTVLDFTFGSCSTGIACINTNRNFIGIELDNKYFDISVDRVKENLPDNYELILDK